MRSESNGNQQAKKSDKDTDFFSVLHLVEFPKWALKFFSITGPIFTIVGFAMITIVCILNLFHKTSLSENIFFWQCMSMMLLGISLVFFAKYVEPAWKEKQKNNQVEDTPK